MMFSSVIRVEGIYIKRSRKYNKNEMDASKNYFINNYAASCWIYNVYIFGYKNNRCKCPQSST